MEHVNSLHFFSREEVTHRAQKTLELVDLREDQDRVVRSYSRGMRQRLKIAQAIAHDPEIIIVDEPMVGLDPAGIKMVKHLFRKLADRGVTFFISTHTLSMAQDLCDHIGIIHHGKLIATGTLDDLKIQAQAGSGDLEAVFLKLTREESFSERYQETPGVSP